MDGRPAAVDSHPPLEHWGVSTVDSIHSSSQLAAGSSHAFPYPQSVEPIDTEGVHEREAQLEAIGSAPISPSPLDTLVPCSKVHASQSASRWPVTLVGQLGSPFKSG